MKFNSKIENLPIYEAGKPIELVIREFGIGQNDIIKLASNENPLGTSKKVIEKIKSVAQNSSLYPDDSYYELKDGLSNLYKVEPKNVIIGSGSDQIIEFALHAKANEKNGILVSGVTFAMYEIYAKHVGAKIYKTKSKEHNLTEFREIYNANKDDISVIFLCLPNNPLGECLDADEVFSFIKEVSEDTLVIIDGAYMEFAKFKSSKKEINPKILIQTFPNALYLGTFSKAYGLGGMRVGYGIANEEIIKALHRLRAPFNITTLSLAAAIEALKDSDFLKQTLENNFKEMSIYEEFAKENGIEFIESYTNFITFIFDKHQNATEICDNLLKQGIILRNLKSYSMNAIRITIGKNEQNRRVLEMLKKEI
ncbi:histidinol-phosphate aminotransferase [Campylobacter fetus subsp. testudinum]|uniref:Histidinol-phosphate aminotransferase n=2 Tax=Campylobacter fetus TaxID=196 RepID=A0AAX0HB99_CAMFE|nr:histidinol-phosphate transaminase [Campylobacter fetus]EAK0826632.1 histidinol-phosphate transaminase [Campylobacter fetus]OCR90877.1 histidinol-phosphate aminotransferase [Campylobacter fetus subsp. testudinum]